MDVFFDTEFTKLPESPEGYPGLISIGCAPADGRRSFYAELTNTWNPGNCSEFVLQNVLPLLGDRDARMTDSECALKLKQWIEGLTDKEVVLRSDNPRIDWPWVEELFQFFGCWPRNLRRKCGTIYFDEDCQQQRYNLALEAFWKVPVHAPLRHHARIDAESMLFAWWHAQANVMRDDEFQELVSTLYRRGVEDGDNGYRYWSSIISNLKNLRTAPSDP